VYKKNKNMINKNIHRSSFLKQKTIFFRGEDYVGKLMFSLQECIKQQIL